jgi:hypothetical protein
MHPLLAHFTISYENIFPKLRAESLFYEKKLSFVPFLQPEKRMPGAFLPSKKCRFWCKTPCYLKKIGKKCTRKTGFQNRISVFGFL